MKRLRHTLGGLVAGGIVLFLAWRGILSTSLRQGITSQAPNGNWRATASDLVSQRFWGGERMWVELTLQTALVKKVRHWSFEIPESCTFDGTYRGTIEWKLPKSGEASYFHGGIRPSVTFARWDAMNDNPACSFWLTVPLL